MKWIGLTGGIGSGKSTVARFLRDLGFTVIDADVIARFVVEPGQPGLKMLSSQFGTSILQDDGRLDRKKLGQLVFANPLKLSELEKLLHPLIKAETLKRRKEAEARGEALAFYDVPLLFEKKMESDFDAIIVVDSSEALQKKRIQHRDQLSEIEIERRLSAQLALSQKISKATWVLKNEGTLADLESATRQLAQRIQSGKA